MLPRFSGRLVLMCKWNKWGDTRIDPCMRKLIQNLNARFKKGVRTVGCCCGHGKYPMTIVIDFGYGNFEIIHGKTIPRKKKIYKRDKQGVYYVPEVSKQ